jgi:hypothetical protein
MSLNNDLASIGYDRGGWHTSQDPRMHLTVRDGGGHQHLYFGEGNPIQGLGRAAIGLSLGGPNS